MSRPVSPNMLLDFRIVETPNNGYTVKEKQMIAMQQIDTFLRDSKMKAVNVEPLINRSRVFVGYRLAYTPVGAR